MMTLKIYPNGEHYQAPAAEPVFFEPGCPLCQTSAEGDYIEPGTGDNWGNF